MLSQWHWVISSLRDELAIPLPENDGEAVNVAALSLILVGMSALGHRPEP